VDESSAMPAPACRGLVVLDVDGVIFRGQLIARLARRRGFWAFLATMADGFLFELGRIELEEFLRRSYRRLKGLPWSTVVETYRCMPLNSGVAETVRGLRKAGRRVVFLTAGVPDELVKDLAERMGADGGAGVDVAVRKGALTGEVGGELIRSTGKVEWVERLLAEYGLPWGHVMAVGDDRNNLPLLRRAGTGVGFQATATVRREARHVVDSHDLGILLRFAEGETPDGGENAGRARRPWHREIFRKLVHLTGAAVPLLVPVSAVGTSLLLLVAIVLYFTAEFFRVNGAAVPGASWVSRLVIRRQERRRMATGPLTLGLGMLVALACFPRAVALACILMGVVADSMAAVVGERWGHMRWPHNPRKTVAGTLVFLAGAFACAVVYLPPPEALLIGACGAFLESLPMQDWDNFLAPVGAGFLGTLLFAV